jgi:hypothetical protein
MTEVERTKWRRPEAGLARDGPGPLSLFDATFESSPTYAYIYFKNLHARGHVLGSEAAAPLPT